ncbi:MAG: hypothetical protein ACOY6N_11660 [Pseudomonadota bacterium]
MKIPAYRYRCPLDRFDRRDDPEDIKRQGWRDQHILVVAENDARLDFVERELIRRIGERLYGEKRRG